MWTAFLRRPETALPRLTVVFTIKNGLLLGMSLRHGAKARSLPPPTGLIDLKKKRMVLFACYNLNGSRLKPCFNHKLEFFAVFQLLLLWRSLKKILLVWVQPFGTFTWNAGHTLNSYPKTDVFVCLLLSVAFFECFFSVFNHYSVCFGFFFFLLRFKYHKCLPLQPCCSIHSQNCGKELFAVLTSISCHVTKYF